MLNQGNILMGYSLALVTTVMLERDQSPDENSVKDAITASVHDHVEKRFNKSRYARGADDILNPRTDVERIREDSSSLCIIINDLVHVISITKGPPRKELEAIFAREAVQDCPHGRVYILLRLQPYEGRPRFGEVAAREKADIEDAQLVSDLQSIGSKIRVEFFAITYNTGAKEQADSLYHLASRVCGAMVEYRARLHPPTGKGSRAASEPDGDAANSGHALEALPLMDEQRHISGVVRPSEVVRKILDLRDAVDLVCEGLDGSMNFFPPVPRGMQGIFRGEDNKTKVVATRYKFPFGVWFRGQSRVCLDLMPSLYNEKSWTAVHPGCGKLKCDRTMYDESTLVHHFMAHRATLRRDYSDVFEWLCLMQHYGAPSRVLDWTENILTALYFAVADTSADCDGAVWALNAGRLNEITRVSASKRYVCLANSTDVILRSAMALSRTATELRGTLFKTGKLDEVHAAVDDKTFWRWMQGDKTAGQSKTLEKLACPVAVFPTRINERESMQLATFTIYGGKEYDREVEQIELSEQFPEPKGLLWVSQHRQDGSDDDSWDGNTWIPRGKPFLDVYVVPSCAKRKLREQLKRVGVHVGSLFPELEYQGKYIRHQWRFECRRGNGATVRRQG